MVEDDHSEVIPYTVKRLFIDIETSLSIVGTFSLWPKYIDPKTIFKEWFIICAAWKWEGSDVIYSTVAKGVDDRMVIKSISEAISIADEIIYHNGRKFDFKKLQTRAVYHKLPPIYKPREIDTLLQARKHFSFTSNKLDYLATYLGLPNKLPTDISLWVRIQNNDTTAAKEMAEYNKHDVVVLEKVFKRLQPYIDIGYNYNICNGLGYRCPSCGSNKLQKWGFRYTTVGKYQRYMCTKCLHMSSSGNKESNGIGRPIR